MNKYFCLRWTIVSGLFLMSLPMTGCDAGFEATAESSADSGSTSSAMSRVQPRSPDALPDFDLLDLAGNRVKLSDFAGQSVFINFFTTTCPPCIREIPDLIAVHETYADRGFVVLGISLDIRGAGVVKKLVSNRQINYPIVMGNREVVVAYGNIRAIPTSFLINDRHELVKKWVGMVSHDQLTRSIEAMLSASPESS